MSSVAEKRMRAEEQRRLLKAKQNMSSHTPSAAQLRGQQSNLTRKTKPLSSTALTPLIPHESSEPATTDAISLNKAPDTEKNKSEECSGSMQNNLKLADLNQKIDQFEQQQNEKGEEETSVSQE